MIRTAAGGLTYEPLCLVGTEPAASLRVGTVPL